MSTGCSLKLHEAIVVVLISQPQRTAEFEKIANEINKRSLYSRKDGLDVPAYQILQRTTLSKGQYHHLFEKVGSKSVKLRNL